MVVTNNKPLLSIIVVVNNKPLFYYRRTGGAEYNFRVYTAKAVRTANGIWVNVNLVNDLHLDYLNNDRVRYRIQLVEQVRASLINNRPFGTIDSKSVSFTDMGFLTADKKKRAI